MTETKTIIGCGAIVGALMFVLFWSSYVPVKTDYLCDIQTNNCFERLALPMEKFK